MDYGEKLTEYVEVLADKLRSGKITEERFFQLAEKLTAWEIVAIRKGLM
jgi:hypothetical protein